MSGFIGGAINALSQDTTESPMRFWNDVSVARQNALRVQEMQAEKAWGNALQQATGPDGVTDYPKARAIAARDPLAMQGMMRGLTGSMALSGSQQEQTIRHLGIIGGAAMSVVNDPSEANVNASFDNLAAAGYPKAQVEAERQRVLAMQPAERQKYAYQHGMAMLSQANPGGALGRTTGETNVYDFGGYKGAGTVMQPRPGFAGGASLPGGGTNTASPELQVGAGVTFPADAQWVKDHPGTTLGQTVYLSGPDRLREQGMGHLIPPGATPVAPQGGPTYQGQPVGPANPPRLLPLGGQSQQAAPPGVQMGGPPPAPPGGSGGHIPSGGIGSVLNPTNPANPPGPIGNQGLVRNPSGTVGTPNAGGLAKPQVRSDVDAIVNGMRLARSGTPQTAQTAGPGVPTNTLSLGPGVQEQAQWKASSDRLAADDTAAANFAQTQFPYTQALSQLGKGIVTGRTSDFWNMAASTLRTPLEKLGIDTGALGDANKRYDELKKWYANIVTGTPFAAGSDARMAEVLNANPNTSMNQGTAEDMLKAGIILQRMNVAANTQWHAMSPAEQAQYGGMYLDFLRGYASRVDPRAFGVDMYNKDQIATLRKSLQNGSEADAARFNQSKALADRLVRQQALP